MTDEAEFEVVEPHASERFKYNGVIHVYFRCASELLLTLIPEGVDGSKNILSPATDESEEISMQKNVFEFIGGESRVNYSPDGTECTFLACKVDAPLFRQKRFSVEDFEDWAEYSEAVWGDTAEMLTYAENQAVLTEWYKVDDEIDTI